MACSQSDLHRQRDRQQLVINFLFGTDAVTSHIRSREVTYLPLSDDCLRGLVSSDIARCEPLASFGEVIVITAYPGSKGDPLTLFTSGVTATQS